MRIWLSARKLRRLGACDDGVQRFEELFPASSYPRGVPVTIKLCVRYANECSWYWLARNLLPGSPEQNEHVFTERIKRLTQADPRASASVTRARAFGELMYEAPGVRTRSSEAEKVIVGQVYRSQKLDRTVRVITTPKTDRVRVLGLESGRRQWLKRSTLRDYYRLVARDQDEVKSSQ